MAEAAPEDETPNQRAARLRREKRNAKMATQGEERLAKIKQLNGGVAPPAEVLGGPAAPSGATLKATAVEDPDEVDISDHAYTPRTKDASGTGTPAGGGQDDPVVRAMLQMQQQQQGQGQQGEEDPMVKMMQSMMGMLGGQQQPGSGDPNAPPGEMPQLPPMLQAMMGGGSQPAQAPTNSNAYVWRIVHAVFAFSLAVYITLTSTFNGSHLSRTQSVYTEAEGYGLGPKLFVLFATFELLLQSSRYFLEKGQLQGSGWLATIAGSGMVPEPYANYIRLIGRYSSIYTTIMSDAMVVVFVFGVLAWWRGMAVS